jgi:UDP-glucose 4-epimerase
LIAQKSSHPAGLLGDLPARIAVTGAAGFLGRHLTNRLAAAREVETIVAIDWAAMPEQAKVVVVRRDIRNGVGDVLADHGIQAIVHLAYVVRPVRDRRLARSINVGATEALLAACSSAGTTKIVYSSSTTVYGAHADTDGHWFTEADNPRPLKGFQYSENKVTAENLIRRWNKDTPRTMAMILRACPVMGPDGNNFILRTLMTRVLPLPAFSSPQMQFLHVDDQCAAFEMALSGNASGTFNVAGEGTVDWRSMAAIFGNRVAPIPARLLRAVTDLTWKLRMQNSSPGVGVDFIRYSWLASTDLARTELGWQPEFSSSQALKAASVTQ